MDELISKRQAIDALCHVDEYNGRSIEAIRRLPPAQPEIAMVTIGRAKGGVTMWYECGACGEPIDICDCYCRKCGRKLKHE